MTISSTAAPDTPITGVWAETRDGLPAEHTCGYCLKTMPIADFYVENRTTPAGPRVYVRPQCRKCNYATKVAAKERRRTGRARPVTVTGRTLGVRTEDELPEEKRCQDCGEVKPRADFGVDRSASGLLYLYTRCRPCFRAYANAAKEAKRRGDAVTAPQEDTQENTEEDQVPRPASTGENRTRNQSSLGFHMDEQYKRKLGRWGIVLAEVGVKDEYAFLSAGDQKLRTVLGDNEEALRTIRRAIKENDDAILQCVFPPAPRPTAAQLTAIRDAREAGMPRPLGDTTAMQMAQDTVVSDLTRPRAVPRIPAPPPTPTRITDEALRAEAAPDRFELPPVAGQTEVVVRDAAEVLRAVATPTPEVSVADAVAAARLLVEADDRELALGTKIAEMQLRIDALREEVASVAESKRRALDMLLGRG